MFVLCAIACTSAASAQPPAGSDFDFDGLTYAEEQANSTDPLDSDSDDDGLWDGWEVNHRCLTTDLIGSDPHRKDIYVEIDRFEGMFMTDVEYAYLKSTLERVFAREGVSLHLELDPLTISGPASVTATQWKAIKETAFDKRIKGLTHRHCLFVMMFSDDLGDGLEGLTVDEQFMAVATFNSRGDMNKENLTGVFMHELGHTLGFGEGGIARDILFGTYKDKTLYKPNHLSVMNYSWTDTGLMRVVSGITTFEFDYQLFDAPELNEKNLNEPRGIGAPLVVPRIIGLQTRVRKEGERSDLDGRNVDAVGAIDWNDNHVATDVGLTWEIDGTTERGTIPECLNEWENMTFDSNRIGSRFYYSLAL